VLGVPPDPLEVSALPIVFGARTISGSLTGTPIDEEDALAFSLVQRVRPMIETMPLARAEEAFARMLEGKVRFRMVLVM
jgi:D-arabinose 1-dehydrogenase-like Zn-dependent alcohol dehydrogenase